MNWYIKYKDDLKRKPVILPRGPSKSRERCEEAIEKLVKKNPMLTDLVEPVKI